MGGGCQVVGGKREAASGGEGRGGSRWRISEGVRDDASGSTINAGAFGEQISRSLIQPL